MFGNGKVFLGGTCNETDWREKLIKMLEIPYFNPTVNNWNAEAQKKERIEKEASSINVYVITPRMVGLYSIAEVVQDSIKSPGKVVFCFLNEDKILEGEII